jgi:hypothetical protein
MRKERRSIMENRRKQVWLAAILALAFLAVGAAALGAQEGPPPPPEGLTFSGSVITGVRYRSWAGATAQPAGYNRFDIDASDDFLSDGDTATLRGALNKGTYGLNFGLALNANNTHGMWISDKYVYANEASLWAKFLNNKIGVKAGYYADFDYFTPVQIYSLGANSAVQLTFAPIDGLQIDVKSRLQPANVFFGIWSDPVWYEGEKWARNIDLGVKYVQPNFTAFVAFDDDSGAPPLPADKYQSDVFAYFGWTGTPKLTLSVEGKFFDLTSERTVTDTATATVEDVGITIAAALNVGYQITDAFSARAWFIAGSLPIGGSTGMTPAKALLGEDGATLGVNVEASYKLNDTITLSLTPIIQIFDSETMDIIDFSIKPKVAWAFAPFPYAATINFSYKLNVYGEDGVAYAENNGESLLHTVALTFGWNF